MLDVERVLNQDRLLRALTGLNRKAFDQLLATFSPLYEHTWTSDLHNSRPKSARSFVIQGLKYCLGQVIFDAVERDHETLQVMQSVSWFPLESERYLGDYVRWLNDDLGFVG